MKEVANYLWPIATLCKKIEPFILCMSPKEYTEKLHSFATLLPKEFVTSTLIFECLGTAQNLQPDFGFWVTLTNSDIGKLHGSLEENGFLKSISDNYKWQSFLVFLDKCAEQSIFKKHQLSMVWLEFDIGSSTNWPPSPSLHFHIPGETNVRAFLAEAATLTNFQNSSDNRLSQLYDLLCDNPFFKQLHPKYISFMLARTPVSCRLYLYGNSLMDIASLEANVFKEDVSIEKASLINLLNKIRPYLENIGLQIGLDRSLDKAIGIECYVPQLNSFVEQNTLWKPLLNILLEEDLISQTVYERTISWLAENTSSQDGFVKFLNVVKFVYAPEQKLKAKIYLGACPTRSNLQQLDILSYSSSFLAARSNLRWESGLYASKQ